MNWNAPSWLQEREDTQGCSTGMILPLLDKIDLFTRLANEILQKSFQCVQASRLATITVFGLGDTLDCDTYKLQRVSVINVFVTYDFYDF